MHERLKTLLLKMNPHWRREPEGAPAFRRDLYQKLESRMDIPQILAVVGLRVPEIKIKDGHCVKKSFPGFWPLWDAL